MPWRFSCAIDDAEVDDACCAAGLVRFGRIIICVFLFRFTLLSSRDDVLGTGPHQALDFQQAAAHAVNVVFADTHAPQETVQQPNQGAYSSNGGKDRHARQHR